jgi:hypothetical protein
MTGKAGIAVLLATFSFITFGGAAKAASISDACSLLTPAQVSAVLNMPVAAGKYSLPHSTKDCDWPPSGGPVPLKSVFVEVSNSNHWAMVKMTVPKVVKTPVSGIGDDAVYIATQTNTALFVRKGDFMFQVRVYGYPPEDIRAKERTLAQDVLANL